MLTRHLAFLCIGWIAVAAPIQAQVVVFQEDFDEAGDPAGWSLNDGWDLQTSSASPGSGGANLRHRGNAGTFATTTPINLSAAASASLIFLARRTDSYGADNLVVTASADGGSTYPITLLGAGEAAPSAGSKWETISIELPDDLLGVSDVVIRFEGRGLYASGSNARIDDVTITAEVPLELSPLALSFSAPVGASDTKSVTATNRTSGTLSLEAPDLSGTGFSISPSSALDLAAGAAQLYEITFTAPAQGSFAGSVRLDFGSGSNEVALLGTGSGGVLGFATSETSTLDAVSDLAVPLELAFSSAVGLQGLQFRVTWSGEALSVSDLARGSTIASSTAWSLSYETGSGYVDVVLLGQGGAALDGGTYDHLLSLVFDVGSVAATTDIALSIGDVIGALAEPDGSDADLSASAGVHVITIEARRPNFAPSTTSVDLGEIETGETSTAGLTVSNPGGNSDLTISAISSSNPLFTISAATAKIAPDASKEFTIAFAPTTTSFGRQNAEITFEHDGEGGSDVISVTGKGRGGRGDAEGDGTVDALDVVHAIDFVLDRLTPNPAQKAAADLFPFPDGDLELDVRDLTVLSQAIVRGQWPDDVVLPPEESGAGKTTGSGIRLTVDPTFVRLDYDVPIRAFQILLPADVGALVDVDASWFSGESPSGDNAGERAAAAGVHGTSERRSPTASRVEVASKHRGTAAPPAGRMISPARGAFDAGSIITYDVRAHSVRSGSLSPGLTESGHELRVLVYRPDGDAFPPGSMHLATYGVLGMPHYLAVVGEERDRLRIDAGIWTSSEEALPNTVLPKKPYPNPFLVGSDVLRIPVGRERATIVIFDLLGRVVQRFASAGGVVEWAGDDTAGRVVGSGVYLVQVTTRSGAQVHTIHVVH